MPGDVIVVVDVGSNSVTLQAFQGEETLDRRREQLELGRLHQGVITLDKARALHDLLAAWRRDWPQLVAVGTAAFREADNGREIAARLGIRVLSGEEEARLVWLGARHALPAGEPGLIFDLGGRSTEFILGQDGHLIWCSSRAIGHLRPLDLGELEELPSCPRVVATAGTSLALAKMATTRRDGVEPHDREGLRCTARELEAMLADPDMEHGPGSDARRVHTIRQGARAVLAILQAVGAAEYRTSERALREGLREDLLR